MIQTVDHVIALWAAAILGGLLIVIVVTFVFSWRCRRDVMHTSNNELAANGSIGVTTERSGTFSVTARGSIIALVVSFLLALIAVVKLPDLSRSPLATNTQASELNGKVVYPVVFPSLERIADVEASGDAISRGSSSFCRILPSALLNRFSIIEPRPNRNACQFLGLELPPFGGQVIA